MRARLGICSIVSDVNHFKHMLFSTFALCSLCSRWNWRWCGLGRRGRRSRRRRRADRQRVRDRQRRRGRRVAELSRAFKQTVLFRATPVLFRSNKSYKVNDQRCLSFVYSFTDIYLRSHFSLALFIWEIWKSYIFVARKYSVIRRTPSFEQILIKQAYFLVKNGASYKWINTGVIKTKLKSKPLKGQTTQTFHVCPII